ncbi:MAG: SpoIIE family protein phosphatase [Bacteroidales bacterium]|jgi:sigma-B regulation protein RsbU (phosphoserine phosphatase)|nr:SpoIIE family protein phosphatase [Bacteroidales bacterium]
MLRKRGLAFRLGFYLLTVGFLVLFAILYYNYRVSRDLALRDAKSDVMKLTELTVARIENVLNNVENIPSNLASVIESKDTIHFKGTRAIVEEVLRNNPMIYGASIAFAPELERGDTLFYAPYLYTRGDSVFYKDLANDNYRYTSQAWYKEAREMGRGVWSEPYFDKGGGDALMATYAVPFFRTYHGEKIFSGVVTADLSLRGLQDLINSVRFFDSGRGFMISSAGNIVTWPEINYLDDKVVHNIFEEVQSPETRALLKKMTMGESGIAPLDVADPQNRKQWISYANVPSNNWSLGIIFKENELYENIHSTSIKLIAIGISGFIILGFLILLISKRFVRPIEKLASASRKIGEGQFDVPIPSFRSNDEVAELGRAFRKMQTQLREYIRNLKETTAQKERIESELEIASEIQQQMLPEADLLVDSKNVGYYGILKPARRIGGDLYDMAVQGDQLYFAIGDVSGKGIPAALFMAKTLTLFRAKVTKRLSPEQIAYEINRDLALHNRQSMFVTCFIGQLNMITGNLNYCNAGHNRPYILSEGKVPRKVPGSHGIPLGSLTEAEYAFGKISLKSGDRIFMYTDGITEAENISRDLYGEDRMAGLLADNSKESPEDISLRMLNDIESFCSGAEQTDDITMLILSLK